MNLIEYYDEIFRGIEQVDQETLEAVISILNTEKTVYTAGNGGSFSNAEHFTQDLIRACGIYSVCLNSNTSLISAASNDDGYEHSLSQQFALLPERHGIVFLISGSGNSLNLVNLARKAREDDYYWIISLVGFDGGVLAQISDHTIYVPLDDMRQFESAASTILHYIIERIHQHDLETE